ncbi:hypothetical protein ACFQ78_37610 [Streptomyces sp. NPDC056519]|uniref:hypothetical protein n=1 Tax=Streptomyces sp. NPDC056519 TaxID=3345849 RepID=UPI0036C73EB9
MGSRCFHIFLYQRLIDLKGSGADYGVVHGMSIVREGIPFDTADRRQSQQGRAGTYRGISSGREPGVDGQGRKCWAQRWKVALNDFGVTFDGRFPATRR